MLQRQYLLGVDTYFDKRTEVNKITVAFERLLSQKNHTEHTKQTQTDLFWSRAKTLVALLPEQQQRQRAIRLLTEVNRLQQDVMNGTEGDMHLPLRARL